MKLIQTEADIQQGIAHLGNVDPRLQPVIALAGPIPLRRHAPGFSGLCNIVVSQQVSVASANAIWAKTRACIGEPSALAILGADDQTLRSCGLSAPKIRTLRAIAEAAHTGALPIDMLHTLSVDQAMASLTAVRGIGPWTAEIYLMFYAGHSDVFAAGDLALQEAVKIAFQLPARPSAKVLGAMAEAWSPWRAVAARLFWAYYRVAKSREGVTA